MIIKASCEVEYNTDDVLRELKNDYPDDSWDIDDAREMIHKWIKDDFGSIMMDYRIEEINGN